jgi:hypothetical protein
MTAARPSSLTMSAFLLVAAALVAVAVTPILHIAVLVIA